MNGNICPQCGKDVMPYGRFLREAEPYKISKCGNCNTKLKRSPRVYLCLLIMLLILIAISLPLFHTMIAANISYAVICPVLIVFFICWVLLTNYLSWKYIGWAIAKNQDK
jgi:hypothetical protein